MNLYEEANKPKFPTEYIKSNMFLQDLNNELSDHDVNFDLVVSDINYSDCPILSINPHNKPENRLPTPPIANHEDSSSVFHPRHSF